MNAKIEDVFTVADLDLMPDDGNRYELIEGEIVVSRAPGLTHQSVSGNLFYGIKNFLADNPLGEVWATPGVIFDDFNGVMPDLVFVSVERRREIAAGERVTGAPELVVEILSPGTVNERRDRVTKLKLYAKFGVKEYWLVNPASRSIDIYRLSGRTLKQAATLVEDEEITSPLLPGYSCKLASIFRL